MRKYVLVLAVLASGCANQQNAAFQNKQQSLQAMTQANLARVRAGDMKRSEYYTTYYNGLSAPPIRPLDTLAMKNAAHMIDVSKALESGNISKDQFDSEQRTAQISMQEADQQLQRQNAQQQQANKQAALAYYLQTKPRTTNCTGTGYAASCTSY